MTHEWNFMKIRPVGAELFHANRRNDMTMLAVPFRNSANAPKARHYTFRNCDII
jgi:hypothetical protein